jgi:hypothetical protein
MSPLTVLMRAYIEFPAVDMLLAVDAVCSNLSIKMNVHLLYIIQKGALSPLIASFLQPSPPE